jgi:DNA-binding transcriptional LysR family regulator
MAGLSLNELKALSALAAHTSFRGAAAGLEISPSSLSHLVASIEKRLGVRLFNRTTRSVAPTEAGQYFLTCVSPALRVIEEAVASVARFQHAPAGLLRFNTSHGGAERILPLILDFMGEYPDVRVDLYTEGRMVDIVAAGFDAGLRLSQAVPQDMVSLPLGVEEAMIVVAAPDYLARRGVPAQPTDLLEHECVRARLPSGAPLRWEFERVGEEVRIDAPGRLIVGSPELSMTAAIRGLGLAFVHAPGAQAALSEGKLVQVLAEWTPPYPGLCLYYPLQKLPSASFRAFLDFFQARRARDRRGSI